MPSGTDAIRCPLCGQEFDPTSGACASACPLAAGRGCNLICCPHCGYQMVDERRSGLARLVRQIFGKESEST